MYSEVTEPVNGTDSASSTFTEVIVRGGAGSPVAEIDIEDDA